MAVDQQQVRITVVVVIEELQTPPAQQLRGWSNLPRFVGEGQVLLIVIQTEEFLVDISHKEVLPAVAIIIGCVHAHAGARASGFAVRHARPKPCLFELAAPFVDEKEIRHSIIRYKQIHQTVVVHIGCDRAERLAGIVRNSRLLADVGKRAVSVVVKEMTRPRFEKARYAIVPPLQSLISAKGYL